MLSDDTIIMPCTQIQTIASIMYVSLSQSSQEADLEPYANNYLI